MKWAYTLQMYGLDFLTVFENDRCLLTLIPLGVSGRLQVCAGPFTGCLVNFNPFLLSFAGHPGWPDFQEPMPVFVYQEQRLARQ